MRILHFSDPHFTPRLRSVPVFDWLNKRMVGGANLALRRRGHFRSTPHKIERLAQFAREHDIDLVLCTGDYTAFGTDGGLALARSSIRPLTEAPLGYVTIPGNHDLYTHDVVRQRRFERHFGDLLQTDEPELAADGPWPLVRHVGDDVTVIAVSSSVPHRAFWLASGRISPAQLEALGVAIAAARSNGRFVFVMTHHAPRLSDGSPDRRNHGLKNADEFLAVCSAVTRGALLCGHVHRRFRVQIPGLDAALFCAGSTTMIGREGLWMFDVTGDSATATPGRWSGDGYVLDPGERSDC